MNNKWLYPAGIVILILVAFFFYRKYRVAPQIEFGQLSLTDLEGRPVQLGTGRGPAIVTFGASWCGSCIRELDQLSEIYDTALQGVQITVVSDEPLEKVRNFRQRKNYPFTFLKLNAPFSTIGVHSLPTTYLFNGRGELKKEAVGYIHWDDASTVNHLLTLLK